MKKGIFFLIVGIVSSLASIAQEYEYARVMHYNLLYYRQTSFGCNGTTNNPTTKDKNLKKIIDYVQPTIFTINELGENFTNASKIVDNVLNTDGKSSWKQCDWSNNSFSNITNMLFYDSDVFELYNQDKVVKDLTGANLVRVIDIYTMYYKDQYLEEGSDTVFVNFVVAHLKAGNSSTERTQRADETEAVIKFLEDNYEDGNFIMSGDFNLYRASETAYQNLINPANNTFKFFDPIDVEGSWTNNSTYASVHTQSTRSGTQSCYTSGGMDDRFDFILISKEIKDEEEKVEYVNNSYVAIGQDGNRFNEDIQFPANNSVPRGIDTALYIVSDHLPVKLDLKIEKLPKPQNPDNVGESLLGNMAIRSLKNSVYVKSSSTVNISANTQIIDVNGRILIEKKLSNSDLNNGSHINTSNLENGFYIFNLILDNNERSSYRFVK